MISANQIVIAVILLGLFFFLTQKEKFSTSPGTLLQLVTSRAYPHYWARGSYYTPHYRQPYYYPPAPYYHNWPYQRHYFPLYGYDHIPGSRHSYYYRKYSPYYY